jgi:hypothetical protein
MNAARSPFHFGSFLLVVSAAGVPTAVTGCSSALHAQSTTLHDADFDVAWVNTSQDHAGAVTLTIAMDVSGSDSLCPVVDQATAAANGVPMKLLSPGALGSQCEEDSDGACSGKYYATCSGPSWSLTNPPTGPLAIVVHDTSGSVEVDVADMGTPRSVSVSSVTDATPGSPGQVTLTWSPAADAIEGWAPAGNVYAMTSDQFGIQNITFTPGPDSTSPALEWYGEAGGSFPAGVMVDGADISFGATTAGGAHTPGHGGTGTFVVTVESLVPTSRCDLPHCVADFYGSPSVSANWQPF